MLEKMDHGEDDISIEDIDFVTQQIKNHTIEVSNICEQSNNIEYENFVGIKHINLFCGQMKRIKIKEELCNDTMRNPVDELFDVVWCVRNYEECLTDVSGFEQIETISKSTHTLYVSKLRNYIKVIDNKICTMADIQGKKIIMKCHNRME